MAQISVPTTANGILLATGGGTRGNNVYITNHDGTNPIFIDTDTTVSSTTSYRLIAGASVIFRVGKGERLYGRSTGGAVATGVVVTN